MKLKFILIDKTKCKWLQEGEKDFLKRLNQFAQTETVIMAPVVQGEPDKIKQAEGRNILSKIKNTEFVCLLDSRGKAATSEELALKLNDWELRGGGQITFIIGGSWGVSSQVEERANYVLSFSKMTFLHEMIRVFLFEQVYRAFTIRVGKTYHK